MKCISIIHNIPITVAGRSETRTALERWHRGFESHPRHGCLYVRLFCVYVVALRRADHSSKESYRLCKKDYETEEEVRAQQRAVGPLMNELMNQFIFWG
jgi:hypothetical protein